MKRSAFNSCRRMSILLSVSRAIGLSLSNAARYGETCGVVGCFSYFRRRSVALDEAVDRAQMLDRVALAPHLIEQLCQVAMRLDHGGIAFEGAIQAANCRVILAGFAIEQSQLVVNLRVSGHDRRRTEEVAQRAFQIAFV